MLLRAKGGQIHENFPIFDSVREAKNETQADCSLIFVPAGFTADAILEAIETEISLIVVITEGVPVLDMVNVDQALKQSKSRMIGPNCPGIIRICICTVRKTSLFIMRPSLAIWRKSM